MRNLDAFGYYDVNYLDSDRKKLKFIKALFECHGQLLDSVLIRKQVYHARIRLPKESVVKFMELSGLGLEKPFVVNLGDTIAVNND